MTPVPPDSVVQAALRWVDLLRGSSERVSWNILRAESESPRFTVSQYASALRWLEQLDLSEAGIGSILAATGAEPATSQAVLRRELFKRALVAVDPAWLVDVEELVGSELDLPLDAADLGDRLGIDRSEAFRLVRQVKGHIDLEARASVGLAGELALVGWLESISPGSSQHVAAEHDGFGYDVSFVNGAGEWHLEVKTTTRAARLDVYLSRHEYETSRIDPYWRLIVIGLRHDGAIGVIAAIPTGELQRVAPTDSGSSGRWQSFKYGVDADSISAELDFLRGGQTNARLPHSEGFSWMPSSAL